MAGLLYWYSNYAIDKRERNAYSFSAHFGSALTGHKVCGDFDTWTFEEDDGQLCGGRYFLTWNQKTLAR